MNPPAADTAPVTDAQVQAWYAARRLLPRARKRDGNTSSFRRVRADVPAPTEEALRQRFQQQQAHAVAANQRLARTSWSYAGEAAPKAAEAKAGRRSRRQARQPGADFADTRARGFGRRRFQRPRAATSAGTGKGAMPKLFEDALFAMQAARWSAPVRTEFGWHVIPLREIKTGTQATFEQVREQTKEQAEADRDRAYNDLTGKVVDEVLKNPTTRPRPSSSANRCARSGPIGAARARTPRPGSPATRCCCDPRSTRA